MKFALLILAYLVGSVPAGYLVGRVKGIDIRQHGSGNIGTTNAFRILGTAAGILVLVVDVTKGLLPVVLANHFTGDPNYALLAGLSTVIGHNWSLFLGFKGGKGVATGAGVLFALSPAILLACIIIWAVVVFLSGYVSLASLIAVGLLPVLMLFFRQPGTYVIFAIVVAIFVIYKHKSNILRLLQGNELKVGRK